jgi:dCMP deaminase
MNALLQCALDETTPKGATIYCTASPCYDCTKAIIRAGIVKVVYGEMYDSRYGLSPTVRQLFASCGVTTSQLVLEIVDGRIRRAG